MGDAINDFYILNSHVEDSKSFLDEEGGKTIYEVLKIVHGEPLFYKEHYERLKNSFLICNISNCIGEKELLKNIYSLVKENSKTFGNVKITYNTESDNYKIFFIKHSYPTEEMYTEGVKTIFYFGERENPNAKVINSNFRNKVNEEIIKANAYEGILVNNEGYITEGSKSNIFYIKDNEVFTSKVEGVLPGVTRMKIIEMCNNLGVKANEENIKYSDANKFDAFFISGTSPDILPIKEINSEKFNVNNELLRKLILNFNKEVNKFKK